MLTLILIGAAVVYVTCGLLAYRGSITYCKTEWWPTSSRDAKDTDLGMSMLMGLFGPFGLVLVARFTGFFRHGFTTKP